VAQLWLVVSWCVIRSGPQLHVHGRLHDMATKVASKKISPFASETEASLGPAKLKKLVIKNFRCIGESPVEIDLDEIVVLVGANNAGKSTILRAYEVVMCHGSSEGKLALDDFPNEIVDPDRLPEIELQTYIDVDAADTPGQEWWNFEDETKKFYVREQWIWSSPNQDPKRRGRTTNPDAWSDKVPWGAPSVAKVNRPIPHRVDAFSSPETQATAVISIIKTVLLEQARKAGEGDGAVSALDKLKTEVLKVQAHVIESTQIEIQKIETELSDIIAGIFKGFKVKIDPRHENVTDKALSLFTVDPVMRMGPQNGHAAPIEKQGSGARRTLLWSALKLVSERAAMKKPAPKGKGKLDVVMAEAAPEHQRPHILLMDEPEICLHPNAIREACRVLYGLSEEGSGWQVMVTTHSPAFIDLSKDNTTIVRVDRDENGGIHGTTVFRPSTAKLDENDKARLKLLNIWDPYVGEFFFGGRSIIVEGDTEYSAFQLIREREMDVFGDVHVIRARGKFIIPSLMKILNQFGSGYAVLHDSDTPKLNNGNGNPAWSGNTSVRDVANAAPASQTVRIVASIPNFDVALLDSSATSDKPYRAVARMTEDQAVYDRVRSLLVSLLDSSKPLPVNTLAWSDIAELGSAVTTIGA
jgi:putative ATP-dependent endonuclease of OLD family